MMKKLFKRRWMKQQMLTKKNGLEEEERGTASDILDLIDEIGEKITTGA